jgi:hypothetical protein
MGRVPPATLDVVAASMRQVLLTNQEAVDYLTHPAGTTNSSPPSAESLRRKMNESVERFLELTQRKSTNPQQFSEVERQQMEKNHCGVRSIDTLPACSLRPILHQVCHDDPEERQAF